MRTRPPNVGSMLGVGDPRRKGIGRAVFQTLFASVVFFVLTAPLKQIHLIYDHAPWGNDPYDTVYSFAIFFVPLIAAFVLVQTSLCRRMEPLSVNRVGSIIRGCRLAVAMMAFAVATEWTALLVGADRSQWTVPATGLLIGCLVLLTFVTGSALLSLIRLRAVTAPSRLENGQPGDWLADAVAVAVRETRWLGSRRVSAVSLINWLDAHIVHEIRRHPLIAAALASLIFGVGIGGNQGIREGYLLSFTLVAIVLLACGMFGFLVVAGSYLQLVQSATHLYGVYRRLVDATVAACIGAVVALALRNSLWWIVGTNNTAAGPGHFIALVTTVSVLTFVAALSLESLMHWHTRPAI